MTTRKMIILNCEDYFDKQQILERIGRVTNAKIHDHKINFKNGEMKVFVDVPILEEKKFEKMIHNQFDCIILSASRGRAK